MFTAAPRNLAQGILVVSNNCIYGGSGSYLSNASKYVAETITNNKLLYTQAKTALGEKPWTDNIVPLL